MGNSVMQLWCVTPWGNSDGCLRIPCRSVLSGSVGIIGRLGGVAAPFLFVWAKSAGTPQMPFWVMGVASLSATLLCLGLPETCGSHQPDTLRDFDRLAERGNVLTGWLMRMGWGRWSPNIINIDVCRGQAACGGNLDVGEGEGSDLPAGRTERERADDSGGPSVAGYSYLSRGGEAGDALSGVDDNGRGGQQSAALLAPSGVAGRGAMGEGEREGEGVPLLAVVPQEPG